MSDTKLNIRELTQLAILGTLTFAGKFVMSSVPNVHPVALMIIAVTIVYGAKSLYSVAVYVLLEFLVYGLGIWSISYLYIWPLLALTALLFRKEESKIVWALIAGINGLCFGALCSIPYAAAGGFSAGFSYWVAGIPFDLIHGASNAVIVFVLIKPLVSLLKKLKENGLTKSSQN